MKNLKKLTREQRLQIVLNIINKLKCFPSNNTIGVINIYLDEYIAIKRLKEIFKEYINEKDDDLFEKSGKIDFPEINRVIYYTLPSNERRNPIFKMEWKK